MEWVFSNSNIFDHGGNEICENLHSEVLKEKFAKDENYKYYLAKYQQKFMKTLEKIIEVANMKIKRSKEKLKHMSENSKNNVDNKEKIESINSHISDLIKQEEDSKKKGDLVKATSFNSQIVTLQAEIKRLNEESDKPAEPNLMVCEICGAMKSAGDMIQRFENHVNGKQHLGFEKIRNALSKLKENVKEREQIIEEYRKEKYAHDDKSSKREKNYRDREHRRRSNDNRRSSKHHRSRDRSSRTHHSIRSKRSRKHSSFHRSRSSSTNRSRERHNEHSSRRK